MSDDLDEIIPERPPELNPDDWLSEEEAKRVFGGPVVCIAEHEASYQGTGTVYVGDTGLVLEMGEIREGSGCWLIAVEWHRLSEMKDEIEKDFARSCTAIPRNFMNIAG